MPGARRTRCEPSLCVGVLLVDAVWRRLRAGAAFRFFGFRGLLWFGRLGGRARALALARAAALLTPWRRCFGPGGSQRNLEMRVAGVRDHLLEREIVGRGCLEQVR